MDAPFKRNQRRAAATALALLMFLPALPAQDLSTTNVDRLKHFWSVVEQKQRPVTVLSFGDSMADAYRSIAFVTINHLVSRLGLAGFALGNYVDATVARMTNGTLVLPIDNLWFAAHYQVPPGGGLWWDNLGGPGRVTCNRVGLFFVVQLAGGAFTLSVSTNAGPWAPLVTLDGYAPSPLGCFTNFDLEPNFYRLRVDGQVGTNVMLGPYLLDTRSTGLQAAFTDWPGIGLDQVTNVPLAIRLPVFRALRPDLLIWHMKEGVDGTLRPRMAECEEWWREAMPEGDVLYIGTPFTAADTNSTTTIDQNTIVRTVALDFGRAYGDCLGPAVSYPWMLAQGYMSDVTHPNLRGNTYLADLLWNEMGFFAVGAPRALLLQRDSDQMRLQYATLSGLLYTLEGSSNLLNWQPLFTTAGNGGWVNTNVPWLEPPQQFRLRLQPAGP